MMNHKQIVTKAFGLQHRYDKLIEVICGLGCRGRVLDLGAREGAITWKIENSGFVVVAADMAPSIPSHYGIPCLKADFNEGLPFRDESFDLIATSNTIEYLEDPFRYVRECYRVLRDRGILLIETPNILNLQSRVSQCMTGFYRFNGRPYNEVDRGRLGDRRMNLQNYFQLRVNLHRNGFRIRYATSHEFSNKAMLFLPLYGVVYLLTFLAFRRERNHLQRQRNRGIFRHAMSLDLILGKQLLIVAQKDQAFLAVA